MNDNANSNDTYHVHHNKLEATAKVAAEAVGIPAAEEDGTDKVQPKDDVYHQHPPNAHHQDGPMIDLGSPGTAVQGGIVSGKVKQALGALTGNKMLKAEGLDDEALALNRSGKESHNVEEMRATKDKALELHRRAQQLRDAQPQHDSENQSASANNLGTVNPH
ncbi:hypothetical protein SCHPADRAFT_909902 [Schizopora paradoxa]|uniref:CsbD-like domain-containing protein n=1 Tax=Schizopora paradoxa TaxID=27342 RepID=A0A0H2R566_9AGAM|nr:hypothetical protein SCHPADRAFT_909902 [Schizopora paradoxa]